MNRELDVKVARAKGLDVVGKANSTGFSTVDLAYPGTNLQPVYVKNCICDTDESYLYQFRAFGHCEGCLGVVPFWSSDLDTAFELVTEMREHSYGVDIKMRQMVYCIVILELGRYNIEEMADTPQEAICNAYLEWRDLTKNQ